MAQNPSKSTAKGPWRTRMAPSPTGEYHIGGMRTLLYNFALAKQSGGQFILRIEDTDRERFVEGATERLMEVIKDYGLSWDEGPEVGGPHSPYIQSQRLQIYQDHAQKLIASGHAYYCFCSKERLEEVRKQQQQQGAPSTKYDKHCLNLAETEVKNKLSQNLPFVIRLKIEPGHNVIVEDHILGKISFPTADLDDQVLIKSDGFPTYHLAVVVDDFLMRINFVLRGVEWLPSTPKHILLYQAFGWEIPQYAHLPLLKEIGDTKKLSKRMGSVAATEFLEAGYLKEALLNFLMLVGWNPGTEKEIYSLEEFIQDFSVERIHKTDLVGFDRGKLLWLNGQYLRALGPAKLWETIHAWGHRYQTLPDLQAFSNDYLVKVTALVADRMRTLADFTKLTDFFFKAPTVSKELLLSYAADAFQAKKILEACLQKYSQVDTALWQKDNLDKLSHDLLGELGLKPKEVFMTLRVAVTGMEATPPLFDLLELLGKEEVVKRIKGALLD